MKCPTCNQIIFDDRPSVLIGLAQQYTNNNQLFPFETTKELINVKSNDVNYISIPHVHKPMM